MKKIVAIILAMLMLCLAFTGCQKYSDKKPMSEKRVEKFLDEKGDQIDDDISDWKSLEVKVDLVSSQNGTEVTQKYSSILDTKTKVMEIDMTNMDTGLDGLTKAYAKGDYVFMESEETGKIKVSVESLGMADMLDAASQQKNFLFIFEDLDSGDLEDMGVEVFVTKTDDGGELYRFELTDDYYEYYFKKMPGLLDGMGLDEMSDFYDLIKITDLDIDTYELTYEFDKDGKLIEMSEKVDMSYTIDMTDMMIKMFEEMMDMTVTKDDLASYGAQTVMNMSVKGKTVMCESNKSIELDESEYEEFDIN